MTVRRGEAPRRRLTAGVERGVSSARALWSTQPVSVVVSAVMLIGFALRAVAHHSGSAASGSPSQLFLIREPAEAVVGIVASLILVGASERRIGGRRTLAAYLLSCAVAALAAVVIHVTVSAVFSTHMGTGFRVAFVPTYAPAVGTIFAASAFAGPLWRRRIRVVGVATCAAFVLFEGNFAGLVTVATAAAGLLFGVLLRNGRRLAGVEWKRSSHHEARVLLSTVVAVSAGGLLASVFGSTPVGPLSSLGGLFRDPLPGRGISPACRVNGIGRGADFILNPFGECTAALSRQGLHGPGAIALGAAPLILLLVAAFYIRRGLRAAVITAVIVNLLLFVAAIVQLIILPNPGTRGTSPLLLDLRIMLTAISALLPLAIAVLLLAKGRHARVASDPRTAMLAGLVIVGAGVLLVAAYVTAGVMREGDLQQPTPFNGLLVTGVKRLMPFGFFGVDHLGVVPLAGIERVLFVNMGWVFWLVVIASVVAVCRHRDGLIAPSQQRQLRALLRQYGEGPLAHMATWDGNRIWFEPSLEAAVAYRLEGDVAITLGDPICHPDRTASVVTAFSAWCDDQGYVPVFYSARSSLHPVASSMGWYVLPVGEETIIRPRTFSMQGKKWQDVRSSVNRAAKAGVTARWTRYVDLDSASILQITEISEQWVADKKLPEMGFTLGGLPELRDPDVRLMIAVADDGRIDAVTSWLPAYRDGSIVGWTLDFMRRRPDSMNGVMEFVIASAALKAQEDDLEFLSLSAAPLVSSAESSTPIDGVLRFISDSLEPAYGFRSLFAFKKKFQPDYEELIMAYPDPLLLPRIGIALSRAYLPELSARHVAHLMRSPS